jgi:hypothetical protein
LTPPSPSEQQGVAVPHRVFSHNAQMLCMPPCLRVNVRCLHYSSIMRMILPLCSPFAAGVAPCGAGTCCCTSTACSPCLCGCLCENLCTTAAAAAPAACWHLLTRLAGRRSVLKRWKRRSRSRRQRQRLWQPRWGANATAAGNIGSGRGRGT